MKMLRRFRQLIYGLSLRQRLPILICVLILCVVTLFTVISYVSVRRITLNSGRERLHTLSDQLSAMFGQQAQGIFNNYRNFSSQPQVLQFFHQPGEATLAPLSTGLQKLFSDSAIVLIELIDRDFTPLWSETRQVIEPYINVDSARVAVLKRDSVPVGNFFSINDALYHPIRLFIRETDTVAGYMLAWRKINMTRQSLDRFSQLIGAHSTLQLGNRDMSLWTNFIEPIPLPLEDTTGRFKKSFIYRNADGEKMLASMRGVPNTRWAFLVEFPHHRVVAPAGIVLKWMIVIGALITLTAIFITRRMTLRLTRPLKQLTSAAAAIASGDFNQPVHTDRRDEIGKLARAFNAMISKVSRSQAELRNKFHETEEITSRLRELSAHLQNIREEERIHIAREMHDELGQLLTGFKMDISWLTKRLEKTGEPAVREKLQEMMELVNEAARFVRRIASELRPSLLDDLGLVAALEWHSQEFSRRANIRVEFKTPLEEVQLPVETATGLFRIYQESLTNVARHAEAKQVIVELQQNTGEILLTISDDGRGFDIASRQRKTLGLLGMKERAAMLGGQLRIYSAPGKGTTVVISIPQHQPLSVSMI